MDKKNQVSSNKNSYQNSQTSQKQNQNQNRESQIHGTSGGEMPDPDHLNQNQQKPMSNR